jgi:hypothetical protein
LEDLMTVKSNTDAAIADLKAELSAMTFLDPGAKTAVDDELVAAIQADMDSLVSSYGMTFRTSWGGVEHIPTALELAHWLFDGDSSHRLTIGVYPTSPDEVLLWTTDVPIP